MAAISAKLTALASGFILTCVAAAGCFTIGADRRCFDFHTTSVRQCSADEQSIVRVTTTCTDESGESSVTETAETCGPRGRCVKSSIPTNDFFCAIPCTSDSDCASFEYCATDTCRPRHKHGESCNGATQCEEPLRCVPQSLDSSMDAGPDRDAESDDAAPPPTQSVCAMP